MRKMRNPFQYGGVGGGPAFCNRAQEIADPHTYATAYVDLWPTDGAVSFVTVTAKAIAEAMSSSAEQLLKTAKEFFGQLTPSVTLDEQGRPKVSPAFSAFN